MSQKQEFTTKTVNCPHGHEIKLEMLSGTPNMIRKIQCPTCSISMIVIAGDVRGVVPVSGAAGAD
jgi:hypothetical protein